MFAASLCSARPGMQLNPALPHDLVCALAILLSDLCFDIMFFVAQYPQGLGALHLDLKLLISIWLSYILADPVFGLFRKCPKETIYIYIYPLDIL